MSAARPAVGAVALLLVVVAVVVHLQRDRLASPDAGGPSPRVVSGPRPGIAAAPATKGHDPQRRATGGPRGAIAVDLGSVHPPLRAHSDPPPAQRGQDFGAGFNTAARLAAQERRREIARNLPDAGGSRNKPGEGDAYGSERLPRGTRFAAAFRGHTRTADGSEPIVEKNTVHDENDGIYFPEDAELAYPNRAGVRSDAGTIAVRVEPVDWEGKDASVHSLFRLNDPKEGDYRFHLLKDSSALRFQFITEDGETNVRVPIDWWPRGESHYVAATWDTTTLRLYIDGVPLGEKVYSGTLKVPDNVSGWWGSNVENGTRGAGAILKDTLVADRPLANADLLRLWEGN